MASDASRFIVRPAAQVDIEEAALWYERRGPGLGLAFLRAIDVAFKQIQQSPERFPLIYENARRIRIRRFPYLAYFVSTERGIQVVACLHGSRDPRTSQRRVDR